MRWRDIAMIGVWLLTACRPERPVTSSIIIDLEKPTQPVQEALYGVTLEEMNHAVEGGIYAEMIRNRSLEDGVVPYGCLYDAARNVIVTPAGWQIPFVSPYTIPGWRPLSSNTLLTIDTHNPLNEDNRRSLFVQVASSGGYGGAVAEGFRGIALVRGEQYDLSFYLRGRHGRSISVALRDTLAGRLLSKPHVVYMPDVWTCFRHTFTATDSARNATLVFEADSGASFYLDVVSLFPKKTWKGRSNGLRADLMEAVAGLSPAFVRFPGGAFVESYTSVMVPDWEGTVGAIESRKPLWSIWGYGTTNGVGFYEYLQLCEDLNARPIYVMNAGVLNQRFRSRYEDMRNMGLLALRAAGAVAYANGPATDPQSGGRRATHGHTAPFGLSDVAFGDANYGEEYARRYLFLRRALRDTFPQVAVMASDSAAVQNLHADRIHTRYLMDADQLMAGSACFETKIRSLRKAELFVGAFGAAWGDEGGTMRAAVGEAAFLVGVEHSPAHICGVSYSPLLGHTGFPLNGTPAILFDASRVVKTPSYHVLKMFAGHRGKELLVTEVNTYQKPLVTCGRASIAFSGDEFEAGEIALDGAIQSIIPEKEEPPGGVKYMQLGDSMICNYTLSVRVRPLKRGATMRLQVRDNGLNDERRSAVSLVLTDTAALLYRCAGTLRQPLTKVVPLSLSKDAWSTVQIECRDETIRCRIDRVELPEATLPFISSLLSVATYDPDTKTIILKVVNTTMHEEWTSLDVKGRKVEDEAELLQLSARPESRNTFKRPDAVKPVRQTVHFPMQRPIRYGFPPNSVTILRLKVKE